MDILRILVSVSALMQVTTNQSFTILNHLIVIFNVFGVDATNMLFMKLHEFHSYLKPFVEYLNFMPTVLQYEDNIINKDSIIGDIFIEQKLKDI